MTRINAYVPVLLLTDEHLLTEHREIPRIASLAKSRFQKSKSFDDIPKQFTLGSGHCKFFFDKLEYVKHRYEQVYLECIERKFNVSSYHNAFSFYNYSGSFFDKSASTIVIDRILEKVENINKRTTWHWYGHKLSIKNVINILNNFKISQNLTFKWLSLVSSLGDINTEMFDTNLFNSLLKNETN